MSLPEIGKLLISESKSLHEAIECIDRSAQGICFIVDGEGALSGCLTDGDIRRAFLKEATLTSPIRQWMQRNCFSLPVESTPEVIQSHLSHKIRHIPLLDSKARPVDYACFHRLRKIQVMEPSLSGNELQYVTDCVRTKWVSSQGTYVTQFEKMFGAYCGVENALAVSNGTVALHLALLSLGIGKGDEVIVPDFTFAASVNAVLHANATPVIVDIDPETWTISTEAIRKAITPKTKAIMPVHLYGHPCDMDAIMALAREFNIKVIEDCAESIGAKYRGKPTGSFGDAATFSFFGNKTITTGEGGMILFRDKEVHERAARLRDHGMSKTKRYWHEEVGYNYRLTNLQAALGVAQMERVDELVARKRSLGAFYNAALKDVSGVILPPEKDWAESSYWLYTLLIDQDFGVSRDDLIQKLLLNGIETRPVFYPLHEMPPYRKFVRNQSFEITTSISESGISLPSSIDLSKADLRSIVNSFLSIATMRAYRDLRQ
jgi:perosamine synthetase